MGKPNCCFMIIAVKFFFSSQSPRGTVIYNIYQGYLEVAPPNLKTFWILLTDLIFSFSDLALVRPLLWPLMIHCPRAGRRIFPRRQIYWVLQSSYSFFAPAILLDSHNGNRIFQQSMNAGMWHEDWFQICLQINEPYN